MDFGRTFWGLSWSSNNKEGLAFNDGWPNDRILYLVLSFFFSLLGCLGGTNLPSCLDIYWLRFQGWALSWWCNMWSTLNKEVIFSFANFYSWTFCIIFTRLLIFWMTGRTFDEKRLWIFEGGNAMCMKSCFWSIIVSSDLWTVELQSLSPLVNAAATNSITPLTQQVDKVEKYCLCAVCFEPSYSRHLLYPTHNPVMRPQHTLLTH